MLLSEICLRDPFVLADKGRYYLYGTRSATAWTEADGFDVYVSDDLVEWSGPKEIFKRQPGFWANRNYWAPECIRWQGAYYLIATFGGPGRKKGIQFLKSDRPDGIFSPVTPFPITPEDWECLDGTFYQDKDGKPYLLFSHGVPEEPAGALCAAPLKADFTALAGGSQVLFYARDAAWTRPIPFAKQEFGVDGDAYFSDGPYVMQEGEELSLLWSSWSEDGYAMGISKTKGGLLSGSWTHTAEPFMQGGGHGMTFASDGRLRLVYHSPNDFLKEHPVIRFIEKKI